MFTKTSHPRINFFITKPSKSKLEVQQISSLLAPPQIMLYDIMDDGRLRVTQLEKIVALVKKKVADEETSILAEAKESKTDTHDPAIKKKLDAIKTMRFRKADLAKELGFKPEYGVIYSNKEIYLVYKGEKHALLAGTGAWGKVKFLQDLRGKWFVLKIIPEVIDKLNPLNEYAIAERAGLAKAVLARRSPSKDNQLQHEIIMEWAPREELLDFVDTPKAKRAYLWINLILQMIKNVMDIHALKIISRDIKLENFMYDPITETTRLIDFGLALELLPGKKTIFGARRVGTPGYLAPETLLHDMEYSEKSDIYSLGTAIALLLCLEHPLPCHFSKEKLILEGYKLIEESHPLFKSNNQIPNKSALSKILRFLILMRSKDPADRPDLSICYNFFSILKNKLFEKLNTGIINLDELIESKKDPEKRYAFLQILKDMDKVWFIESKKHTVVEYNMELRDLIRKNIPIGKYIFSQQGAEPLKVIEQIPAFVEREEKDQLFHLAYVTQQKIDSIYLAEKKILVIHAGVIKGPKTTELRANRFLGVDSNGLEQKKCGMR